MNFREDFQEILYAFILDICDWEYEGEHGKMWPVICQETNGLHHTTFFPALKVNLLVKILTFSGKCPQSLSPKASFEKEEANLVNPAQVLSWKRPFLTTFVEGKVKMETQNSKFPFSVQF